MLDVPAAGPFRPALIQAGVRDLRRFVAIVTPADRAANDVRSLTWAGIFDENVPASAFALRVASPPTEVTAVLIDFRSNVADSLSSRLRERSDLRQVRRDRDLHQTAASVDV
jgi:hypothetical protein